MFRIFKNSFGIAWGQRRVGAIVWFLQFCLAATLGMQAYDVLQASIGNSLEVNKLMQHYDHTVITDFLKVHGASITPLIGQLRWIVLIWLLASVFLDGGLLACASMSASERQGTWASAFWQAGAKHYFSFLKIAAIFLLLALLWSAIVLLPLLSNLEPLLRRFSSEKYVVWMALGVLTCWLMGLGLLFVWSVLSRLQKIRAAAPIVACVKNGWRFLLKNWPRCLGLLALFVGFQALLLCAYFLIEAFTGMTSPGLVLLLFVVQQAFAFARVQVRQMVYATLSRI